MVNFQELNKQIEFRYAVAKLSKEQLQKLNVRCKEGDDLRSIVVKMGIDNKFIIDGKTILLNSAKKDILVNVIWDSLAEERYNLTVVSTVDNVAIDSVKDYANETTETDLGEIAKSSFEAIVSYVNSLWEHGTFRLTDSTIISMTGIIARQLKNRVSHKTNKLVTATTIMRYKSAIKRFVSDMIEENPRIEHYNKIVEIFGFIYGRKIDNKYRQGELDKALAIESTTKKVEDTKNFADRKKNQSVANV